MLSAKETILILGLLFTAWLGSLVFDNLGWWLFAAAIIWIALQAQAFRRLHRWSTRPLGRPDNAPDTWFGLAYRPYRALLRQRARTHTALAQLREVLGLTEVIPDAVITLSANGEIESLNNAARQLLNLTDKDVGLRLAAVVRDPEFVAFLRTNTFDEPLEITSPFRQHQTLEARRFDAGTGRTVLFVRDITALNRLLTMRQDFIANVSHELRTPLTVINGYLEPLMDSEIPQEQRLELAGKLKPPVDRMQSLIRDLLVLTQLESGDSAQAPQPVAMRTLIAQVAAELEDLRPSGDSIELELLSDAKVLGIEKELHSVCTNLVANALRYSAESDSVKVSWINTDNGQVRLKVDDKGLGIPQEHLNRITERFYRIDMADSTKRGGTGLGLAIVKHVLRRHNSKLNVTSKLGRGSTFYCDFTPYSVNSPTPSQPSN